LLCRHLSLYILQKSPLPFYEQTCSPESGQQPWPCSRTRTGNLGSTQNPSRHHFSLPSRCRHGFPPLPSASPCQRSAPGSLGRRSSWHTAVGCGRVGATVLACSEPGAGMGQGAAVQQVGGRDASMSVWLSNFSFPSRDLYILCAIYSPKLSFLSQI
jgi:hypothetical protein